MKDKKKSKEFMNGQKFLEGIKFWQKQILELKNLRLNLRHSKAELKKQPHELKEQLEIRTTAERMINKQLRDEIDERKRIEKELQISEIRFRRLFETAQDGILILDADTGKIVEVNQFLIDMLGYAHEDFLGKKLWEIGAFTDIARCKAAFQELQVKGYVRYEDLPLQTKDGRLIEVEFVSNVYQVDHMRVIQCNIRDITERRKIEKMLQESSERFKYMSFHDDLTGLYNRAYFAEEMTRVGKNLSRSVPVSIISIDIDGLKLVNDTFGHKAGDELLIAAAKIISTPFREGDMIARIGGDEFCIILPGTDYYVALAKKDEIVRLTDAYNNENPSVQMHISLGVASSESFEGENIYDIYQRADGNMYADKRIHTDSPKSGVIDVLLTALSERDFMAQGHAERLVVLAVMMAERMHFSDDKRKNLILLAKVHDLGNVSIPDEILFKPRKLSGEEYEKMKEHVRIGHTIANRSKELFPIAHLILHHHECWDGNGYCDGLKGEQIPLACRIFSITDAYDALTNARPYREGIGKKEAIEEIRKNSGTQFEPRLVDEFVQLVEKA